MSNGKIRWKYQLQASGHASTLVDNTTRLPAKSKSVDISVACEKVERICRLILTVVIESGKKAGSGCQQELRTGQCIPAGETSGWNLSQITTSNRPVKPRAHLALKCEVNTIRILTGD
jgi:hypothetical protein